MSIELIADAERKFEEYRDAFKREIGRLLSIIYLYRHIHEKKSDRLDAMNIAPAFFGCSLDAFFTSIVIWTHKLT